MAEATALNARRHGLHNVNSLQRDIVAEGTGLPDGSVGYAMLFNILHADDPKSLLREAYRTLQPGGAVAVMHWIHCAQTPRGPPLSIRPLPQQCMDWSGAVGLNPPRR
jgi:Methyltransferase domain